MATSSSKNLIQLAKALPEPLQRFFARWPPAAIVPEGAAQTRYQELRPNPFRFYKHPVTGKWQDPVYSQRRQAQLAQMARSHGVEHLLPETSKGAEQRLAHRVEHGLRVKGTGVGQSVKGHIHERQMISKYAHLFFSMPALFRRLALFSTNSRLGWRRGERPCWKCPNLSKLGRG
jgi:large subunit ribosomal protein L25